MGLLILAGFGFLGWEVYKRATDPNHPRSWVRTAEQAQPGADGATPSAPAGPALPAPTTLPAGSRIDELQTLGNRVLYRVTLPDGSQQVHLLDPRSGRAQILTATEQPAAR
ncbi:MAG TPA: hypothetical protein VED40_14830 [Azospirillaceae bacterium]|nr:hypothetical protein [Azospirillaceae bacterium]